MPVTPSAVLAILVVALTALGPLSTDFYLPALPAIARALHTDSAGVQLTLSVYLLGFGAGQLLVGPLSDRFGRRPVMLWGMLVFLLSSAVCVLADSLATLVAARLVQAFGACVGPVLGRAVVVVDPLGAVVVLADSARMLSHVSTATALAPLLAPLLGGWLTAAWGWRATFVALALYACVLMLAVWLLLKETNRHPDADALRVLGRSWLSHPLTVNVAAASTPRGPADDLQHFVVTLSVSRDRVSGRTRRSATRRLWALTSLSHQRR